MATTTKTTRAAAEPISVTHDRQQQANGGRQLRPCPECGTPTTGRWCSARCHQADEPGAYGVDR